MSVPFRVRRAEWVAGCMLILAVVGVLVSLVFASGGRGAFDSPSTYRLLLVDGHGVAEGSGVEMLGIDVGRVTGVRITEDNRVEVEFEVRSGFVDKVRLDTEATLQASFGLQGVLSGIGIALTPGSPDVPALEPGATVASIEPEHIADMLPGVKSDPLVQDLEVLIHNLRVLSDEATDPDGSLRQALDSLARVSKRIDAGEGTAGRMLSDDAALYDELAKALDDASRTLARVDGLVGRSSAVVRRSSASLADADDLVASADALVERADAMVASADTVLEKTAPVLEHTDDAVGSFGETVESVRTTNEQLRGAIERLDALIEEVRVLTDAAGRVYPIRRHMDKARRKRRKSNER